VKPRFFGILLLLSLIAPVVTGLTVLHFQRKAVRKQVKNRILEGIPNSEFTLIKISPESKNIRWKHSKEFEFKGEMYDVVRTEKHGDTTYYYCWWDNQETLLNQKLNENISMELGQNATNKSTKNKLISFYKSLYFSEEILDIKHPFYIPQNPNEIKSLIDLGREGQNPAVPPPEMA
jgi:hypothetical protein